VRDGIAVAVVGPGRGVQKRKVDEAGPRLALAIIADTGLHNGAGNKALDVRAKFRQVFSAISDWIALELTVDFGLRQ
jgi:hypothetical protein